MLTDNLVLIFWRLALANPCGPVDLEADDLGAFAEWWLKTWPAEARA